MPQTKIMATLADNRASAEFVRSLREAGLDSVRINSAHVTPEGLRRVVDLVRSVDPDIAILMDTKGPELRTTAPAAPIALAPGDLLMFGYGTEPSTSDRLLCASSPEICDSISPGDTLKIDDGAIELEVLTDADANGFISCRVSRGGSFDARKTIALPGGQLPPLPAVSDRDREMILAGVKAGIDMIAHSFVRSAADVEAVRSLIEGSDIELYAKIECRQGVEKMEEIARVADGLLVARGDLATAIDIAEIPVVQYRALMLCRSMSRRSIVATQILQSMISAPAPTRAEVSDIALAVMEGADTLLLCGETAQGSFPRECVDTMRRTILSVESNSLRCKIK